MEGHDFEYYCAELLKNNGFYNVSVTQGSGDQGIDVLAEKGGVKYGIQCKCYSSDIGNKAVQEAFSGCRYYNCHVPDKQKILPRKQTFFYGIETF